MTASLPLSEGYSISQATLSIDVPREPAELGLPEPAVPAAAELPPEFSAPDDIRKALLAVVPPLRERQAVVSIDDRPHAPGAVIAIDGRPTTLRRPAYFGFVDLAPGNSWPHDCLHVLCDDTGGTRVLKSQSPPALGDGRQLRVIARGEDVPPWGAAPPYRA